MKAATDYLNFFSRPEKLEIFWTSFFFQFPRKFFCRRRFSRNKLKLITFLQLPTILTMVVLSIRICCPNEDEYIPFGILIETVIVKQNSLTDK